MCFCRTGSLLGLALCMPAMCRCSSPDIKLYLTALHQRLTQHIGALEPTDSAFDVSGFISNFLHYTSTFCSKLQYWSYIY